MYEITNVGVVGAGTMGNGIAQTCAVAGISVLIVDINDAAIQRGVAAIGGSLDRLVKKEKLTGDAKNQALARINGTTDYGALGASDLIIEAATENLELKLKILRQVDGLAKPDALLAS